MGNFNAKEGEGTTNHHTVEDVIPSRGASSFRPIQVNEITRRIPDEISTTIVPNDTSGDSVVPTVFKA
jgi:hypothetical protein